MEDKELLTIPFIAHEHDMTRLERANSRLWITVLVLIFALLASNLAWYLYERSFESYEENTQEITQTASGNDRIMNMYVGGDYGNSNTND